ncbi:MAG: hypothetical protein R2800_00565 [Flavipsychrobacter sp.]
MKKLFRTMLIIAIVILAIWIGLTIWVEIPKGNTITHLGEQNAPQKALIVYNPDPLYNLDEQVCNAFAQELAQHNIYTTVATIKASREAHFNEKDFDLYVFCANTYNWRPDWPTNYFVKEITELKNKKAVAITLGSGSTAASKAAFEKTINKHCNNLLFSETYWLMRPNDEERMKEKNVLVAIDQAKSLAKKTAAIITP